MQMNLIAHDLVLVHPMSSMSGYISYIKYTAGSNKGATTQGTLLNDPFRLGNVDADYTSSRVVENITVTSAGTEQTVTLAWAPVVEDAFTISGTEYDIVILDTTTSTGATVETGANLEANKKSFKFTPVAGHTYRVKYIYDNVVIPQNDLPTINASMEAMPLLAKARRIAVYYSQIAAFQAKTDYGMDLGDQLAEKAVGQLSYEIDTEICNLLIENAVDPEATGDNSLVWSKTLPIGVSKAEHYEGFAEVIEIARQKIYDATKRFAPNYMLCASNLLPVLSFIKGFQPAPAGQVNGPYFAGTLGGLKVFVTPNITPGKFVIGVNGDDFMSSAAVYAPYMAVVPTQLLQYADGGTTQGFSTLYDLKLLNKDLIVTGRIA